jgi:leucyl/phenylalanyl-tRNA--protein transferase
MRKPRRLPVWIEAGSPPAFPDPSGYDEEGMVAVGGDLDVDRLLCAYRSGVFPWYSEDLPIWWSPDPRAVLELDGLHVSRRLRRRIRRGGFELTWNRSFEEVMAACGADREGGTWILPELVEAYGELHALGHAHSLEVWIGENLVGGVYGVQVGGLFAAESMFHRVTDMSKVALVALTDSLAAAGMGLIDVQFQTEHLASLGSDEIPREEYLRRISVECLRKVDLTALQIVRG